MAVMVMGELQARVEAQYAQLGLPSWPDPHGSLRSPEPEEYSRISDPGRYRIVQARARVWAAVLGDAQLARVEAVDPGLATPAAGRPFDRGTRLVPHRSGSLALLLLERDVPLDSGQGPLAVLDLAVVRPDVVLTSEPDCGCDACDSGSAALLEAVDATVQRVVGGPFVAGRGPDWSAEWFPDGGRSGGSGTGPDHDAVMALCRRLAAGATTELPPHAAAFVGRAWFD